MWGAFAGDDFSAPWRGRTHGVPLSPVFPRRRVTVPVLFLRPLCSMLTLTYVLPVLCPFPLSPTMTLSVALLCLRLSELTRDIWFERLGSELDGADNTFCRTPTTTFSTYSKTPRGI